MKDIFRKLDKDFGEGAVRRFTDINYPPVKTISTGSLLLDRAIGGPKADRMMGIPLGRITIVWGEKGCGKTTLAYHAIAEAQKAGLTAAFMDVEKTFDPGYAATCGVDLAQLVFAQTHNPETGVELSQQDLWGMVEVLVRTGEIDLICIDSIDRMVPRQELDGDMGESHPGLRARINGQAMRKLTGALTMQGTALLAICQVTYKIGEIFGDPRTLGGGQALWFATSLRINMQPRQKVEKVDGMPEIQNVICRIPLSWNKIAPPCGATEIKIRFGQGIDRADEIRSIGADIGAYKKAGAYYYFTGSEKYDVQGEKAARAWLLDHPEIATEIEEKIRAFYQRPGTVEEEVVASTVEEPEAGSVIEGVCASVSE